MTILSDFPTATQKSMHIYADGTSGDDTNDGLSAGSPKKTLIAAIALLPDIIRHDSTIHMTGVFDEGGFTTLNRELWAKLILDGGDAVTLLAGPFTSTSSSVSSIADSGESWSTDEHVGYWIEILDGPAAGETRTCYSNDGTTLVPFRDWSVDPGIGTQFRVVRPTTTLQSSTGWTQIVAWINRPPAGALIFQRLFFTGTKQQLIVGIGFVALNSIISEVALDRAFYFGGTRTRIGVDHTLWDPDTFAYSSAGTTSAFLNCGANVIATEGTELFLYNYVVKNSNISIQGGVVHQLMHAGCRVTQGHIEIWDAWSMREGSINSKVGYRPSKIDNASGSGLILHRSPTRANGFVVEDCGAHGIEVDGGSFDHEADTLSGSGNAGAGMYAHSGAHVHIQDGSPPTITGTVGDLAISDPTVEEETWANIDAGVKVSVSDEMTMAKEV